MTDGTGVSQPWPLVGGRVTGEEPSQHDLLVTGHEDGSVRFWDASGSCLRQLLTLRTARLFGAGENTSHSAQDEEEEEEWLHFHKASGSALPWIAVLRSV